MTIVLGSLSEVALVVDIDSHSQRGRLYTVSKLRGNHKESRPYEIQPKKCLTNRNPTSNTQLN